MSIRGRFVFNIGLLSLVFCLVLAWVSYRVSVEEALGDARTQGAIVFNLMDSARTYFGKSQRPLVTELVEDDRFYPEIMSGFVMSRGVWEIFEKRFPGYKFKQATLDPLYPPNKADGDEVNLIKMFAADANVKNTEGNMTKDGISYYYFARPIVVADACLRCHGDLEDAPKDQIEIYGTETGYGWQKGEVVSTSIVYVPLDNAMAAAKKAALRLFALGSAGIFFLVGAFWFFLSSGVVKPLVKLQKKTNQISLGQALNTGVSVNSKDEIGDLAMAIDRLRISTAKLLERCARK